MVLEMANSQLKARPSQNPKTFGEQMRLERKSLHKTQAEIAKACGLDRKTIIALEKGENVSVYAAFAMMAALGRGFKLVSMRPDVDEIRGIMDD